MSISFWTSAGIVLGVSMAMFCAIDMYPRMDMDCILNRSLTYLVLLGIFFTLYAILLKALKQFTSYNQAVLAEFFLYFLLAAALLFYPLQKLIQGFVNRLFFSNLPDYRTILCDVTGRIAASLYLPDLIEELIGKLPERLQITGIGLMIMDEKRSRLYPEDLRFGSHLWSQSRLINLLREKKHFFFCNPVAYDPDLSEELQEIQKAGFSLVYGLQGSSRFRGMLLMGAKNNGSLYSSRDVQIFNTLANQVTIAVENALNYETLAKSKNQLQQVYDKLMQAEKMATLGEMTAILAHELKNPLAIIRSSAQFLEPDDRGPEMRHELLHYIIDEVDNLNLVISNLLGMARHKPPRFRKVDLRKAINDFVSKWRSCNDHNTNVKIKVIFPEHLPVLYADFKQIRQVLLNCVANSEEVMVDGGQITISVRQLDNERVEILLTDTGPGIAEDAHKLVFKKFFTTKKKGVGLGLPVCRQIVRAHNGSITLINAKDGGVSVLIRLPLQPLVTVEKNSRTRPPPISISREKRDGETDTDN